MFIHGNRNYETDARGYHYEQMDKNCGYTTWRFRLPPAVACAAGHAIGIRQSPMTLMQRNFLNTDF